MAAKFEFTSEMITALILLAVQYGLPALASAIGAFDKEVITLDDIDALKLLCKPPGQY